MIRWRSSLQTLQGHMQFKEIPKKLIVSKRLAQCLNPALPTGVHQRALDVYAHILAVLGVSFNLFISHCKNSGVSNYRQKDWNGIYTYGRVVCSHSSNMLQQRSRYLLIFESILWYLHLIHSLPFLGYTIRITCRCNNPSDPLRKPLYWRFYQG